MSKSSLITVLALLASVSAKPHIYDYGPYTYPPRTAYTAAEFYNPAVSLPAAYPAPYPGYPPLSRAYAPLTLPVVSAYSNKYNLEGLAALYNPAAIAPVAPLAPVAPDAPVAPLTYAGYTSPYSYSYYYKR